MRIFLKEKVPMTPETTQKTVLSFLESDCSYSLEIGCGVGFHPIRFAITHPQEKIIAIERTQEKFKKFHSRFINHHTPPNLLPLHADAVSIVTHCLPDKFFKKIFILYPNPELKNKNQRWINMPFFSELRRVLSDHGEIELRTNIEQYAEEVITKSSSQKMYIHSQRSIDKTEIAKTHFEKKYLLRDQNCIELILKKDLSDEKENG